MKKILALLVLGMILGCSQEDVNPPPFNSTGGETVADGLKWYDVIEPFYIDIGPGGSAVNIVGDKIEGDGGTLNFLDFTEFDDAKNYVGAERGKIVEGDQTDVIHYNIDIKPGYTVRFKKGSGLTAIQFEAAADPNHEHEGDVYADGSRRFYFNLIPGFTIIPIGTIMAELEFYKSDDLNTPLGSFFIVL